MGKYILGNETLHADMKSISPINSSEPENVDSQVNSGALRWSQIHSGHILSARVQGHVNE